MYNKDSIYLVDLLEMYIKHVLKIDVSIIIFDLFNNITFYDYTKQAKYYSNMALKAQGAIEVLEQLVEGE